MFKKVLILGDVFFNKRRIDENIIDNKVIDLLKQDDSFVVCNVESPITESTAAIQKCGPVLKSSPDAAQILKNISINLASLANNHIKDYGIMGINDTIALLQKNGIDYLGICSNNDYQHNSYFVNVGNKRIGLYSLCENEFSGYCENEIGANVYETPRCLAEISSAKEKCDYLIILFHGGKELYKFPTPNLQKNCRLFIDSGADFVVCQHSHCVGSKENYKGKNIIYGQGNFYFDQIDCEEYKTSLLLCLSFDKTSEPHLEIIPLTYRDEKTCLANQNERQAIETIFYSNCDELNSFGSVHLFNSLIAKNKSILYRIFRKSKWYIRFDTHVFKGSLFRRFLSKKRNKDYLLFLYNQIKCETHYEVLLETIKDEINKSAK